MKDNNYESQLIELGAYKKSDGIYEYDGFFLYPTKVFAMEKKNTKNRIGLDSFIKKYKQDDLVEIIKLQKRIIELMAAAYYIAVEVTPNIYFIDEKIIDVNSLVNSFKQQAEKDLKAEDNK